MKKILALYDEEEAYCRQLAEYANRKEGYPFRAVPFTSAEKLERYAKENRIELLLLPESCEALAARIQAGRSVLLTEREREGEETCVCKFQPAGQLLNRLARLAGADRAEQGMQGASVFGVYSPVGRCGKTTFALLLGQVLARKHSVLYLSLEEFSGVSALLSEDTGGNLSDAYFYFMQGTLGEHLKELAGHWHELDILPGVGCPEDLYGITQESMEELLRYIAQLGLYDTLIIDMGSCLRAGVDLLPLCSLVYVPVLEDGAVGDKLENFHAWLEQRQNQGYACKTVELCLPYAQRGGPVSLRLEYQLWGEAGDYVRSLVKCR